MLATEKLINDLDANQKRAGQLFAKFEYFSELAIKSFAGDRPVVKGVSIKTTGQSIEVIFCQKKMQLVFKPIIPQGQSYLRGSIEIYSREDHPSQSLSHLKTIMFNPDGETELKMPSINDLININVDTHVINLFLNLLNELLIA